MLAADLLGRMGGMRRNAKHESTDVETVRGLIREHPWAIIVSGHEGGVVASHYPILLDEEAPGLAIVTHVGRPDEQTHGFGEREVLLIVQGRHGYVSPSWYAAGASRVPTWNFSAAHCYGVPEILDDEENLRVLGRLVEHFERHVREPLLLEHDYGANLAKGTVGLRVPITRFVCKQKLSQDKDALTRRQVITQLEAPGPYRNPGLAADMRRVLNEQ
jgi:transcriptional regulator